MNNKVKKWLKEKEYIVAVRDIEFHDFDIDSERLYQGANKPRRRREWVLFTSYYKIIEVFGSYELLVKYAEKYAK